jgi:hypothetical protein
MHTNKVNPTKQLHDAFPCISIETIEELMQRDLLHIDGDEWRFGDESNDTTRKLDWPNYKRADTTGPDWHRLIGVNDVVRGDRRQVLLAIEGSKGALAAAELARRAGILTQTGIVCGLGSGYRPIRSELEQLRGRWVGVIGDNDAAGLKTIQIVSSALTDVGIEHAHWNWVACQTNAKDVFGWLASEKSRKHLSLGTFFSPSPSPHSSIQLFNRSTTETAGLSEEEKLGIIYPFIVSERGTGNAMSFQLARAIKVRNMTTNNIDEIFHLWFAKSRPLLPPDANEAESLERFYRQLKRVRFTDVALKAACERARRATPPFIPAHDGNHELSKLAALHRKLQRIAGDRPYICPVNVAQAFLNLRWPSQANWLNHVLENEHVIECVDRGVPNKPGQKGKPTMWKYKLPLHDGNIEIAT